MAKVYYLFFSYIQFHFLVMQTQMLDLRKSIMEKEMVDLLTLQYGIQLLIN